VQILFSPQRRRERKEKIKDFEKKSFISLYSPLRLCGKKMAFLCDLCDFAVS